MSAIGFVKKKIDSIICNLQGGYMKSSYIRNVTKKKYNVDVGMYSYGGCFRNGFNNGGKVIIGNYCSFAEDIHYCGANHPITNISTSPYFYRDMFGYDVKDIERHTLTIGNDVWIGYGVKITSSCHHIGNGAVIGTGSIVTHDVEPYTVVAGNPARVIKKRFSDEEIKALTESKWYEYSPEYVMKYYKYIDQPIKFAECIINNK